MFVFHLYVPFLVVIVVFQDVSCVCEESQVIICDDLSDIRRNETASWRHVQVGSSGYEDESPRYTLNSTVLFYLPKTKFLTIINQICAVRKFLVLARKNNLRYLNLYNNNIIEISDFTFSTVSSLREVYLKNNNIKYLGRAVFQNLTLDVVDVSQNRIQSITSAFHQTRIKWLLLNHNKINFIGYEPFPSNLQQLELSDNQLESLEVYAFTNLKKLKELFLNNNHLTTIPDISPLKQIQYLHFAYNQIEEVHFRFDNFTTLNFLDLSFNIIKNVTTDVFTSGKTPPIVTLTFNRLTNMVFEHPERKTDLSLLGNPWNCDCWFKMEKILSKYKHYDTCELDKLFSKGDIPMCIQNGECGGPRVLSKSKMDDFFDENSVCREKVKMCMFRY